MRLRLLALASLFAALAPSARAAACGGLFCSTAPVVQAGEEIVYALEDDGSLTMSVRLFYSGTDTDIAWILPLPAPPEITIGSTALFTQLRAATAPTFIVSRSTVGVCRVEPSCVSADGYPAYSGGCGYSAGGGGGWMGGYVDAGAPRDASSVTPWDSGGLPDGGVVVFSEDTVGPYDTVVLGAASASEVTSWLSTHGYQLPSGTSAILDHYATSSHVFIALRLAPGHTTNEIAPITMHLPVPAPCLPIRLTALATAPDLPITAWFLGRARVVPTNFSMVEPTYADERFWTQPGFYSTQMTREITAAGGQAFVTEYAGPTPAVSVELAPLGDTSHLSASELIAELLARGTFATQADALRIVGAHVSPPSPMTLVAWLNCLSRGFSAPSGCGATSSADLPGLLAQCETEIFAPRRAAQAMIDSHPYVTRLFTSMSAAKMTLDPEFRSDPALHDVPAVHEERVVTQCDASHYRSDAPSTTSIGGTIVRSTPGVLADDASYCHARGLYLPSERTTPPPAHHSLCGCRAGHGRAGPWLYALALGALGWGRSLRRRRRHARRAG